MDEKTAQSLEMRERALGHFTPDPDSATSEKVCVSEFASLKGVGLGVVRILKHDFNGRVRVLMRRWYKEDPEKGFEQVLLNFYILPKTELKTGADKSKVVRMSNFENYADPTKPAPGCCDLAFILPEHAAAFCQAFEEGKKANLEQLKK